MLQLTQECVEINLLYDISDQIIRHNMLPLFQEVFLQKNLKK